MVILKLVQPDRIRLTARAAPDILRTACRRTRGGNACPFTSRALADSCSRAVWPATSVVAVHAFAPSAESAAGASALLVESELRSTSAAPVADDPAPDSAEDSGGPTAALRKVFAVAAGISGL